MLLYLEIEWKTRASGKQNGVCCRILKRLNNLRLHKSPYHIHPLQLRHWIFDNFVGIPFHDPGPAAVGSFTLTANR